MQLCYRCGIIFTVSATRTFADKNTVSLLFGGILSPRFRRITSHCFPSTKIQRCPATPGQQNSENRDGTALRSRHRYPGTAGVILFRMDTLFTNPYTQNNKGTPRYPDTSVSYASSPSIYPKLRLHRDESSYTIPLSDRIENAPVRKTTTDQTRSIRETVVSICNSVIFRAK